MPNVFLAVCLLLVLHCVKNVSIVSDFPILIRGLIATGYANVLNFCRQVLSLPYQQRHFLTVSH